MPNKQKLSVEEKISLIWDYLNNRISRSEAARRGGVARETISQWARNYEADGIAAFPAAPAAVPGFFGLAGGLLFFCAMAELLSTRDLDPARRERDREDHDERGAMIRAMARARAGDVLLWLLLFGAAYLYFFGVPKWVSLILLTLACVKLLLDWMFTVWYRRQY